MVLWVPQSLTANFWSSPIGQTLPGRLDSPADSLHTRYLVSDACYFAKKPLVTAAVGVFDGTLTTIRAHERGADYPQPQLSLFVSGTAAGRHRPGLRGGWHLGALTGVIGSMMALEAMRETVGFGEGLVGRLLMIDARALRFETLSYGWDPDNPLSGTHPTLRDLTVQPAP